jgi:hypothetical protein
MNDAKTSRALSKDFGWQVAAPLWTVLSEKDVLTTFSYHVADLAGIDGARQKLRDNPESTAKLDAVLSEWHKTLGK